MMDIIKNKNVNTTIILEEYIPLKVQIERRDEPVKYVSYSKDKSSLLEIAVGVISGFILKIVLLLSKEYNICDERLKIDVYEIGDVKVSFESKSTCSCFKTYLYEDGIKVVISEVKSFKYVRMDKLYIGVSNLNSITEICLCHLTPNEIEHIKRELHYQ